MKLSELFLIYSLFLAGEKVVNISPICQPPSFSVHLVFTLYGYSLSPVIESMDVMFQISNGNIHIKGRIVSVMESWPLQLIVDTETVEYIVDLLEDTKITQHGNRVGPGILCPGLQISVDGKKSTNSKNTITAQSIVIY